MAEKKSIEKKETPKQKESLRQKETQRAYTRYMADPVFVGLAVLAILLVLATFYFASGANCPKCKTCEAAIGTGTVAGTNAGTGANAGTGTGTGAGIGTGTGAGTGTGSKLVILEFSDFKCPYCSAAGGFNDQLANQFKQQNPNWEAPVPKIEQVYGDKVDLEVKSFIVHETARKAGEAGECARDQSKYMEMYSKMFANQANLEVSDLKGYAAQISGMDTAKFNSCLDSGVKAAVVQADTDLGKSLGVTGTPTFFIGGQGGTKIVGAQGFSAFKDAIDKALNGEKPTPTSPTPVPAPTQPTKGPSIGTFDSNANSSICKENGKPIIRMFSTTWCPHCQWVGPAFNEVVSTYVAQGKIVAHHWQVDTGDDTLTPANETKVPDSELAVYKQFNPAGSIPTFVFGCKYYRVGTGYEATQNLEAEKKDFRDVINALLNQTAA